MVILGTRPEAVKVAPVIHQLARYRSELDTLVVSTAQHRSMLDQVLRTFDITPDRDLDIMRPNQTLTGIAAQALNGLDQVMDAERPDLVLVQGDTTTAFAGGLCAFYRRIPVGHIEAGLRTGDKFNPYPEEVNRRLLGTVADLNFAPTATAASALRSEGVPDDRITITGNTVIDALLIVSSRPHTLTVPALRSMDFGPAHQTVLVTAHRRENLGAPMVELFCALRDLLEARPSMRLIFPVHLNPRVREVVSDVLGDVDRAVLIDPLDYLDFVHLMKRVDLIVTDSGGIQEEAPALGVPVLVARETTERPEAIAAGTARLVGTSRDAIVSGVAQLLDDEHAYARMKRAINPFGDGHAADRIVRSVRYFFDLTATPPSPFNPDLGDLNLSPTGRSSERQPPPDHSRRNGGVRISVGVGSREH